MLTRDQAQEQLKKLAVADWHDRRLKSLGLLSAQRAAGKRLLAPLRPPKPGDSFAATAAAFRMAFVDDLGQTAAQLDRLSPAQFRQLADGLFPRLGPHVDRAWQTLKGLPYSMGYLRRGFRAPNDLSVTSPGRMLWLRNLAGLVGPYEQDAEWLAAWAGHVAANAYGSMGLGVVLAAAIDGGGPTGDRVLEILKASARGEHEVGVMGRHVVEALLVCSRPEAWEFAEGLLLAAQREEGLRQVILESIDFAHLDAFRRMLRVILDHDLLRFSAAVRAADVWFGFQFETLGAGAIKEILEHALGFLESPETRDAALGGADPQEAYLALWAHGIENAPAAVPRAAALLDRPEPELRFVGAFFLGQTQLSTAFPHINRLLDDPDPRIAAYALSCHATARVEKKDATVAQALERLFDRAPEKDSKPKPILWPWCAFRLDKRLVCTELFRCTGETSPLRLLEYVRFMEPYVREQLAGSLGKRRRDPKARKALLDLAGDASPGVRQAAIAAIGKAGAITAAEANLFEGYLTRKAADLRRGLLSLLLRQPDAYALASADRLLAGKTEEERAAGAELLRLLIEAKRSPDACRKRLEASKASEAPRSHRVEAQIEAAVGERAEEERGYNLANGLGLIADTKRAQAPMPKARPSDTGYAAAAACIAALDKLVDQNRTRPVALPPPVLPNGEVISEAPKEALLGELKWGFPTPPSQNTPEEPAVRLPLRDLWEEWFESRPAAQRDADGLELVRASLLTAMREDHLGPKSLVNAFRRNFFGSVDPPKRSYPIQVDHVLQWMLFLHFPPNAPGFLIDALENLLSLVPPEVAMGEEHPNPFLGGGLWQEWPPIGTCLQLIRETRRQHPDAWTVDHDKRLWPLLLWMQRPTFDRLSLKSSAVKGGQKVANALLSRFSVHGGRRWTPQTDEVVAAFRAGIIGENDVIDHLLTPMGWGWFAKTFSALNELTRPKERPLLRDTPGLREIVDRVRDRVLEIELKRGDTATSASGVALSLGSVHGAERTVAILRALGNGTLSRGYSFGNESRECIFSHLLRASFPIAEDTPESFARLAKEAGVKDKRLVEFAVYAPQWAALVEQATGMAGLQDAVWWVHAHTKDIGWRVDNEIREWWAAEVTERTPLTSQDLIDGAVDVAWFHRAYTRLGEAGWKKVHDAAKYASSGTGHGRARLFADAMLGTVQPDELVERALKKRHQDSARALGLVPLPAGAETARAEVLKRYETLQEFLRTSRQFGSQRQANEKRATAIGLDNLARTAGYPDPIRLQWAMERLLVADLARGPVSITEDDVTVSLSVGATGEPDVAVTKAGKPLKSVPAALKKHEGIKALLDRKTDLRRQTSRMRKSLELAMCRGDRFTGSELVELFGHPVLAPMLRDLVFIGEGLTGYPIENGRALRAYDGSIEAVGSTDELRIAHAYDLLQDGRWDRWQHDCFAAERVQPFKQVFRELYVLTDAEREEEYVSRRYAGHQVHPHRALALLGGRGWVNHPELGVRRTYHDEGVSAWVEALNPFFTPAEIEGITLEGVRFSRVDSGKALRLEDVPPRVFSEVMRDMDLVVSVAHRGGVDPEASASTVEMRAALLKETLEVLAIHNVRIENRRAIVEGKIATYSVHLGSAVTHAMPGGMLFIVPVGAQHRGRLFLPFADDDPRTAEVLSKVILLARDAQIKDPNIIEQIRRLA